MGAPVSASIADRVAWRAGMTSPFTTRGAPRRPGSRSTQRVATPEQV